MELRVARAAWGYVGQEELYETFGDYFMIAGFLLKVFIVAYDGRAKM